MKMANKIDVKFPQTCSTLEHVCSRRHEFPLVVRTREEMVTFPECPIKTESKEVLLVEREMKVHCALVKVLPFHDERKAKSKFGAELFDLHKQCIGEEFYIPLDCPGILKVVPYPRRRKHFTSVTEILKDNPRYVRTNADIVVKSELNENPDHTNTKTIASGTILETKAVILLDKSRHLKCVDSHGNSCFLPDKLIVDFTGLADGRDYKLAELVNADILFPTAVKFNEGSILPHEVRIFGDEMVSKTVTITSGPLEIVKVLIRNLLITRLQEREGQRAKIALIPSPMWKQFHVQYAVFRNADDKSKYLERNFAGSCLDANECTKHTMYLLPVTDNHVCWLQAPSPLIDRERSLESSSSGDITQQAYGRRTRQQPIQRRLSANTADKFQKYREFGNQLAELHNIELMPQLKVKDHDTVQQLRQKKKLGFEQVHTELKRLVKGKFPSLYNKEQNKILTMPQISEAYDCTFNEPNAYKVDARSPKSTVSSFQKINCTTPRPLPPIPILSPKVPASPGTNRTNNAKHCVLTTTQTDAEIQIRRRETPRSGPKKADHALLINNDPPPSDMEFVDAYRSHSINRRRQLPQLPLSDTLEMTDPSEEHIYFDMTPFRQPCVQELTSKVTARIQPLTHDKQKTVKAVSQPWLRTFQRGPLPLPPSPEVRVEEEEVGEEEAVLTTCGEFLHGNQRTTCRKAVENRSPTAVSFFTYSVQETVNCLKLCGLDELADICNNQTLDGDFFRRTDEAELVELLNLSKLQVLKLKMIYNGWRPKKLS